MNIPFDDADAKTIRRVQGLHLDGWTQKEIVDRLNECGTPIPHIFGGRRWTRATVRFALAAANSVLTRAELALWITAADRAMDGMTEALRILSSEERLKASDLLYRVGIVLQKRVVGIASDFGDGDALARLRPAQESLLVWPTDEHPQPVDGPKNLDPADARWIAKRRNEPVPGYAQETGKGLN